MATKYIVDNISGQTISGDITISGGITTSVVKPLSDNQHTLGTPELRWSSIYVGEGTIFITDTVTGNLAGLTVTNGVLLIDGANQLQVGELKFVNNTIESTSGTTDIQIGLTASTANLILNRNTVLAPNKSLTFGNNTEQTTAYVPPVATSFDPLFRDVSGTTQNITTTGSYTMIAPKICFFRVYVDFSGCTNFGNSQYIMTLPFPSVSTMRQSNGTLHQPSLSAQYHIAGITDLNTTDANIMKFYYHASTTDLAWKYNTPVSATTVTSHFDISGTYEIQ